MPKKQQRRCHFRAKRVMRSVCSSLAADGSGGKRHFKTVLALVLLTVFVVLWLMRELLFVGEQSAYQKPLPVPSVYPTVTGFLVNSNSCQLPDYHPWDRSIAQVIGNETPFRGCDKQAMVTIVQQDDLLFVFKNETMERKRCNVECCYQSVTRASEGYSDDKYRFGTRNTCFQTQSVVKVEHKFIRIRCFCNNTKATILEDFRAFVPSRHNQNNTSSQVRQAADKLNVYLIGIDSVSRLNFKRFLPDIERLMKYELNAIPMLGLNKVGVNTFPNMLPFLTGIQMDKLNQSLRNEPFDKLPFVWKHFSRLGYVTMFNEDTPEIATFNYKKQGFYITPTDYYLRPVYRAIEDSRFIKSRQTLCINQREQIDFQLQWLEDFMTEVNHKPQFALVFSSALSHHGPLTYVKHMQKRLRKFFYWYKKSERYNSSILIFFSDHGMRYGPVMRYELGGYESRMPFFYIILPPWYSVRYPDRVKNLHQNSARLTTFFDAHATLRHILRDMGATHLPDVNNSGISLFETVPFERSCEEAGINDHWCVCRSLKPMSVNEPAIQSAAVATVDHINEVKLREVRALCANLTLLSVTKAFHQLSHHDSKVQDTPYSFEPFEEYVVQFVTRPGLAEFEATVRDRRMGPVIVVDVSRLNVYRGQSDCLTHHFDERRFCYCENLL